MMPTSIYYTFTSTSWCIADVCLLVPVMLQIGGSHKMVKKVTKLSDFRTNHDLKFSNIDTCVLVFNYHENIIHATYPSIKSDRPCIFSDDLFLLPRSLSVHRRPGNLGNPFFRPSPPPQPRFHQTPRARGGAVPNIGILEFWLFLQIRVANWIGKILAWKSAWKYHSPQNHTC